MPIPLACDSCGATLNVGDEFAGRKVKCPKCKGILAVPAEAPRSATRKADADQDDDRPARKRRRDNDDRPRRKRKGANKGLVIGLSVGGALLIAGIVLTVVLLRRGSTGERAGGSSDNTEAGGKVTDKSPSGIFDNPKVTEDNFDKIKEDATTRAEIEALLGKGVESSRADLGRALHEPKRAEPPGTENWKVASVYLKWKNKNETIILLVEIESSRVEAGWFIREQNDGKSKNKLLGFPKL